MLTSTKVVFLFLICSPVSKLVRERNWGLVLEDWSDINTRVEQRFLSLVVRYGLHYFYTFFFIFHGQLKRFSGLAIVTLSCSSSLLFLKEKDPMNHLYALLKAFLFESVLEGTWGWVWIVKLSLLSWTSLELFLLHSCFFALDDLIFNSKRFLEEKTKLFQPSYVLYFKLSKNQL